MNRDHKGQAYSIATDDEERFEFLVKQAKNAQKKALIDLLTHYESLLNQEFSDCRFKNKSY